jgi:hypothetical protein
VIGVDEMRLPEDLAALERELAARPRPRPTGALRERVMGEVRGALARDAVRTSRRLTGWEFAAALAAAVMLWMNLSMIAASDTRLDLRASRANGTEVSVAALRELVPGLSEQEARREVTRLGLGLPLVPAPNLEPSVTRWIEGRTRTPPVGSEGLR